MSRCSVVSPGESIEILLGSNKLKDLPVSFPNTNMFNIPTTPCSSALKMDFAPFHPFIPIGCFAAASLLTIASLSWPRRTRLRSLGPIGLLSFFSLATSHKLSWPMGLDVTFASLVVFYLPYSIKILAFDEHAIDSECSTHNWSLVDRYRTWNNPRMLPVQLSTLDRTEPCDLKSRARFMLHQMIKTAALWAVHCFVFQKLLTLAVSHVVAADFSPGMELPRISQALHLSFHQLQLRTFMTFQWIWIAFFLLESSHCFLSIVFVAILGLDQPEDWPPIFGSPLEASSLKGFWGRFWHRITIPICHHYSVLISRNILRLQPGSRLEKTVVPWLIFTMSGLSHALVAWSMRDAASSRDILFFELNFLAAALETVMFKAKKTTTLTKWCSRIPQPLCKSAGFAWVLLFFFCTAPMWIYPKVYSGLEGRHKPILARMSTDRSLLI